MSAGAYAAIRLYNRTHEVPLAPEPQTPKARLTLRKLWRKFFG